MEILKTIITIIFVIDCIALSAIILLQEAEVCRSWNNQWGSRFILGTEQGTFYGKVALVKSTKFLAILFIVLAVVLNLSVFN